MTRYARHLITVVLFLLSSASFAWCASVSVQPSGNGVFIIHGNNMDGVAGIDLIVNYDKSLFSTPKIDQGSLVSGGAMFSANPNFASGSIRIAIVSTKEFSGSGQIAVITFASHSGTGGLTVTANMINSRGTSVSDDLKPLSLDVNTPTIPTIGTAVTPAIQTYLSTVTMPTDVQSKVSDTKPAETNGVPPEFAEPVATKPVDLPVKEKMVSETKRGEEFKTITYKGALENFREYGGKKTPALLIALMNKKIATTIHQEPAVVLSDGKTPVKILVKIELPEDKTPDLALDGAKLISLNRGEASFSWIFTVLPELNAIQTGLIILTGREMIEYPVTLAPVARNVLPVEADFIAFLKDSGTANPKHDLNGDGKHDYLDDFIYTVNYMMKKGVIDK